jgi:hypothetical protein
MEDGDDGLLLVASGDIDGSSKKLQQLHVTSGINHRLSNAAIFADTVEEVQMKYEYICDDITVTRSSSRCNAC